MPEIVELEKLASQLRPAWVGRQVERFTAPADSPNPTKYVRSIDWPTFSRTVRGAEITFLSRYGKFLIAHLDGGLSFWTLHPSQTGWFLPGNDLARRFGPPDPIYRNFIHTISERNIRLKVHLNDGQVWHYHDPRTWGEWGLTAVNWVGRTYGPDWLIMPEMALKALCQVITRRPVRDVLTDQMVTAGLGNYLACEVCYLARVDPRRGWGTLVELEKRMLAACAVRFIAASMRSPDHSHWNVFRRKGQLCGVCGKPIVYLREGSRGTYYCPRCQT